jgi:hypothetical protein
LDTKKIENPFYQLKLKKNLVTKVVGNRKMHIAAKNGGQDSKVCYRTCTNLAQVGRKPSEILLGGMFCEEFFYETLVCHVWYFF